MPITSISSDPDALTLTMVGEYPVSVERLWDAWSDPRQIERFWGPPTWPATFTRHDLTVGGRSDYFMTGPDGECSRGYFVFQKVEPHRSFEVVDGFTNDDGTSNDAMPTMRMRNEFEPTDSGSRFTLVTSFPDLEAMQQIIGMGMQEGLASALGQMEDVLADLTSFVAGATGTKMLSDTLVRVSRIIRGTVEQVWQAHHDPELMQRWLLGPDGWTMPVCIVADRVGDTYRYEWESADGAHRFGFEGELLERSAPTRAVTTERMIGTDGPSTTNELTLRPVAGGTLLNLVITYPSIELRDTVLATGMTEGMETSYARLESVLAG